MGGEERHPHEKPRSETDRTATSQNASELYVISTLRQENEWVKGPVGWLRRRWKRETQSRVKERRAVTKFTFNGSLCEITWPSWSRVQT